MIKQNRDAGFTFIELMLAASIFAVVAVVVYSTFASGIFAWNKTQQAQNLYQDIRLTLDKMAQDLENAVLFYPEEELKPNFTGESNIISFYSLVDDFRAVPLAPRLRKITYSLDGTTFNRLDQSYAESVQEEVEQEPEAEQLLAQVGNLSFSYCYAKELTQWPYECAWEPTWDAEQSIPRCIKIELTVQAEENLTFTKYVFIPTGKLGEEED